MKNYVVALVALVVVSVAISGLVPGGWDVLIPKLVSVLSGA